MFAAVLHTLGQPPRYQEFTEPIAGDGLSVINMRAAGLHPIVKARARGQHYSITGQVPAIPGIDGVGAFDDGKLVYCFTGRPEFGTMAQRSLVARERCFPLPEGLDPLQAAAIVNPGMSAWGSLKLRAAVSPGETVLILGATGVAGQLAIQSARILGAKRVIAAGRNLDALESADIDATVSLNQSEDAIRDAFAAECAQGVDVVIDYLWGRPTELFLEALAKGFNPRTTKQTRLVEVGESAGKTIALPGSTLRSIDLKILGSGFGSVPLDQIFALVPTLFSMVVEGKLKIAIEPVPLASVEQAWNRDEKGRRIVFAI